MKKFLSVLAGAVLLFGSAGFALAYTPNSYQVNYTDTGGPQTANLSPTFPGVGQLFSTDPTTGEIELINVEAGSGFVDTGTGLAINGLVSDKVIAPDGNPLAYYITNEMPNIYASTSTVSTAVANLSSWISSLGTPLNIAAFMGNNGSTTPFIASSTQNGFMSAAMATKVAGIITRSMATSTRSIVTGTGATGFQVSSTRDSEVRYSTTIVTTSNIAGSQSGTVVLEIAPTNSATSTDWAEIGRCTNGTSYTLAVAIQGVATQACQITGYVPAGYYEKIRSINNSGTPTFSYNSGQEILQ